MVRRYGPHGSFWRSHPTLPYDPIHAWQIWNEPNHLFYWSDQPFARGYVRLARAARDAIKGVDPRALVVSAGFADRSWKLIRELYRAGAKGVFDVISIHPYTLRVPNVLKIVELDRRMLRRLGDPTRPLWATEITWSSGKGKVLTPLGFETTEAGQAGRLELVLPLLAQNRRRLGLQRIYWESWMTYDHDGANTFDYSGLREAQPAGAVRLKPAFDVFAKFAATCRQNGGC
jgi:hypothetical protein